MAAPAAQLNMSPRAKQLLTPIGAGFRMTAAAPMSSQDAAAAERTRAALAVNARKARLHLALTLVALASLGTGVAAAETVYDARLADPAGNARGASPAAFGLKLATTLLTAALLALLALCYLVEYQLQVLQGHTLASQPFVETELLLPLLLEAALLGVHAPVGVYALWSTTNLAGVRIVYDADSLLSALMLYRFKPLLILLMDWLSGFRSDRAVLIGGRVEVRLNSETATRYLLKKFAVVSTVSMYVVVVALLTYCMRVVERPLCRTPEAVAAEMCPNAFRDLDSAYNAFWFVLITSLTVGAWCALVEGRARARLCDPPPLPHLTHTRAHTHARAPGYGDLTPVTHLGRFVATVAAVLGVCVIALLVNAVAGYSKLDEAEDRACSLLELSERNADKQRCAARLQRDFVRFCAGKWLLARAERAGRAHLVELAAHHLRYSRPLFRSLAAWRAHKLTWLEARRRKDTLYAVRQDLRELRNLVTEIKISLRRRRGGGGGGGGGAWEEAGRGGPEARAGGAAPRSTGGEAAPAVQVHLREPEEGKAL